MRIGEERRGIENRRGEALRIGEERRGDEKRRGEERH